ncbi:MAG: type II toxin-antitoxin system ParD family antitoxin [Phenylobacterium sp.]|nr:type II toxin-antitoxin system ParD family antitoxin [Phenylobacterium sp.]
MHLNLPPELAQIVEDAMRSGRYSEPVDVIREALSRLDVEEAHFLALKREIEKGINSPVVEQPISAAFANIKRRGRAELAARRAAE